MIYRYKQTNSGGGFDITDDLSLYVFIEAGNESEADKIAESKGIYFNGCDSGIDCDCCGDRWEAASEYLVRQKFYDSKKFTEHILDSYFAPKGFVFHPKSGERQTIKTTDDAESFFNTYVKEFK